MLDIENACLVVVDVQGKLSRWMHRRDEYIEKIRILVQAAKILDIPILLCQQVPESLGPTIEEISELLTDTEPISKACFSCCESKEFVDRLKQLNRREVLLCGIETHICIYQTAMELADGQWEPNVVADAVSSRSSEDKELALDNMRNRGIEVISTEQGLFSMLKTSKHPKFRQVAALIK